MSGERVRRSCVWLCALLLLKGEVPGVGVGWLGRWGRGEGGLRRVTLTTARFCDHSIGGIGQVAQAFTRSSSQLGR
jgi:hypothetical protein